MLSILSFKIKVSSSSIPNKSLRRFFERDSNFFAYSNEFSTEAVVIVSCSTFSISVNPFSYIFFVSAKVVLRLDRLFFNMLTLSLLTRAFPYAFITCLLTSISVLILAWSAISKNNFIDCNPTT